MLGTVYHFYWKKEYQAHGAPHYHAPVWIEDAPVIGQDDPDKVLGWIQERITCHIPNKESENLILNYMTQLPGITCTSVVATARAKESVVMCSLPDVSLVFHGYLVRAPS